MQKGRANVGFPNRGGRPFVDYEGSEAELRAAFEGVKVDPWTEEPCGFLSMAWELECRRARSDVRWQDWVLSDGTVQRVPVRICPPGAASGSKRELPRRKASKKGRGHLRAALR